MGLYFKIILVSLVILGFISFISFVGSFIFLLDEKTRQYKLTNSKDYDEEKTFIETLKEVNKEIWGIFADTFFEKLLPPYLLFVFIITILLPVVVLIRYIILF